MKHQTPPPNLEARYSGISPRLVKIAQDAKNKLYMNKTVPDSFPRRHGVRLPPSTTREAFDEAIATLRKALGEKNVALNDRPLVDG